LQPAAKPRYEVRKSCWRVSGFGAGTNSLAIDRTLDLTREAYAFVHDARVVKDAATLKQSFATRARAFGFHHYVCLQLRGPGGALKPQELFGEADARWVARYMSKRHFLKDPVLATTMTRDEPFAWSDVTGQRALDAGEQLVMDEARDYGSREGFVTPFRNIDGSLGNVTLFARQCELSEDTRTSLHIMSLYFAGAARRLNGPSGPSGQPHLSRRERDIVSFLSCGFTQAEVSDRLNISPRTVETLVHRAKLRLGVATTAQLCVEAIRAGLVSL
jgi:DNA-binding CsgD family transcriptional regulator